MNLLVLLRRGEEGRGGEGEEEEGTKASSHRTQQFPVEGAVVKTEVQAQMSLVPASVALGRNTDLSRLKCPGAWLPSCKVTVTFRA